MVNGCAIRKSPSAIAARLQRKMLLPVCTRAIEEWQRATAFKSCRVAIINKMENDKTKIWIDTPLLKKALADLLETAAQSCKTNKKIGLSVLSGGTNSCCIAIEYRRLEKPTGDGKEARLDAKTYEIISQHRGKIETVEEKHRGGFLIHLPH